MVQILARRSCQSSDNSKKLHLPSVSSKMKPLLLMFRKHKIYFCGFSLIKYLIRTPQTRTRYFPVPDTR